MSIGLIISTVFLIMLSVIFCTFFSSRLAQLKNRSKAWGLLGFFLNFLGLIIVCFLPSKRNDTLQTNPVSYMISKLPSLSRKTIGLIIAVAVVIVITLVAYDNIPVIIQNYKYSRQILNQTQTEYEQPRIIEADISEICIGSDSTFAISSSGDVFCWGRQLSNPLEDQQRGVIYKSAKKVSATEKMIYILTDDNKLYAKGSDQYHGFDGNQENINQFKLISDDVYDFSISETTVGYIKTNGRLYMFGDNSFGQLGTDDRVKHDEPESVLRNVKKVVCEATFTVAINESGTAYAFGSNVNGQMGIYDPITDSPVEIANGITDIACGDDFILLLTNDGSVLACGDNSCGQLGIASDQPIVDFTSVMTGVSKIEAAKKSSFALKSNGELYAWGQNNVGQLGSKNTDNVLTPLLVETDILNVKTSGLHTVVLTTDKKINASGYNNFSQLGKGQSRDTFQAVTSIK